MRACSPLALIACIAVYGCLQAGQIYTAARLITSESDDILASLLF